MRITQSVRKLTPYEPGEQPKDARVVKLETNYRSLGPILDLANASIRNNREQFARYAKVLRPARESGGAPRPRLVEVHDGDAQADELVDAVRTALRRGFRPCEIAVLYRSHFHAMEAELALTKLDILSGWEKIPVCTGYEVDGKVIHTFPVETVLAKAKPVYEYVEGFGGDISGCRKWEDLPLAARNYILYLEKAVNCPIGWVSVGAGREEYIRR